MEKAVSVPLYPPCWRKAVINAGLFTSPHLVKINERFQINEVMVSDEVFLEAFCRVKELADSLVEKGEYHPTYFEFLFLMGMLIFQKEEEDYIVLETGLGGRLDATNSVRHPLACVITFYQPGSCRISGEYDPGDRRGKSRYHQTGSAGGL